MTQTRRSHQVFTTYILFFALLALCTLMPACNTTIGTGGQVGTTRIGGSVGSSGSMIGISTSVGPGLAILTYKDVLFNGPSVIRQNHKEALKALKAGQFTTAATVFQSTLKSYPNHPDATYYLGLTHIYQGQRELGFTLLKSFRDPSYYRMTSEVQRMGAYLAQKEDLTPNKIHEVMNRYRIDGYNQDVRELRDYRNWGDD